MNSIKLLYLISSCLILTSTWGQNSFTIQNGASVTVTGNANIVIENGKLVCNGTFSAGTGMLKIQGDAASSESTIEGSTPLSFYKLIIDKSSNDVLLNQDISVENTLDLQGGYIDLQNANLTIESGGNISNADATKYIKTSGTGSLIQEVGSSPVSFPIGKSSYNPASLQNSGITDNFSIRVTDEVLENGVIGNPITDEVVNRTWLIEEQTEGGSILTISTNWFTSDEATGFDRTACYLAHYTDGVWLESVPAAAIGVNPWSISRTGVTSLSPFAVSSRDIVNLPIEGLVFQAYPQQDKVQLKWLTASEINTDYFEVEHSIDGFSFKKIGEVKAAGYSSTELQYEFLHQQPVIGENFYRLKQVDRSGDFKYSIIKLVKFTKAGGVALSLFPNPAREALNLHFYGSLDKTQASITLHDLAGKAIWQNRYSVSENDLLHLSLPHHLIAGAYLLQIVLDNHTRFIEKVLIVK